MKTFDELPSNEKEDDLSKKRVSSQVPVGFDDDILAIFKKADALNAPQTEIKFSSPIDESNTSFTADLPQSIQDPEVAYKLYHGKYGRLMRAYVPKGEASKLIREQICLFLKEGHTKGRDSKFAYYFLYEKIVTLLEDWIHETQGKDTMALFSAILELNRQYGYSIK